MSIDLAEVIKIYKMTPAGSKDQTENLQVFIIDIKNFLRKSLVVVHDLQPQIREVLG